MEHFKKNAKRILYKLRGQKYLELYQFTNGRGKKGADADLHTLRRLIKKGLVSRSDLVFEGYCLTEEGRKVAQQIAEEVDEYKSW